MSNEKENSENLVTKTEIKKNETVGKFLRRKVEKGKKKKPTLKQLLLLSEIYGGCVIDIANALGVSRRAVYNWKKENKEFEDKLDHDQKNILVPLAIHGLKYHLEQKSEKSIHYTLDRLARDKGFGMNMSVTQKNDLMEPYSDMTEDEILAEIQKAKDKIESAKN